jgi:hypothetical protein
VIWPAASTFGNILSRAGLTSLQKKRKRTTPCPAWKYLTSQQGVNGDVIGLGGAAVVFPMRTWRTERKIWHGRLPKKHWPFWILMRCRRRHGPIQRSAGNLFATARKTISSSLVRRVDKGVTSVRNRILERPFRWLYQIEESYSNETNSNVPAVGNVVPAFDGAVES